MRRLKLRLRNQRGFTLILMTFMFTVLIGAAAFAVDFGQMYVLRAQLHAASDGAALAGAQRLMSNAPSEASDTAIAYAAKDSVGKTAIVMAAADVIPGNFTFGGGFVPTVGGSWTTADAIKTTARFTGSYGFGRFFGFSTKSLTATSIAAVGSIGATACIKPVAIPYQALLDQIYPPGSKDPSWNLTPDDVIRLQGPHTPTELKLGTDAVQGNFYLINMGPYSHADQVPLVPGPTWGGDNIFVDRFASNGSCSMMIAPGDWLQGKTGNAAGPTEQGVEQLCGITISGNGNFPCPNAMKIKVAMWGVENDAVCTPRCFQVKYNGVFVVTGFSKYTGTTPDGLWGYFTDMASDGAFTTVPGPLLKIALVQ
jgi:Flp pilus assembly protein TadG